MAFKVGDQVKAAYGGQTYTGHITEETEISLRFGRVQAFRLHVTSLGRDILVPQANVWACLTEEDGLADGLAAIVAVQEALGTARALETAQGVLPLWDASEDKGPYLVGFIRSWRNWVTLNS
jgi:hypothetical protein